MNKKFSKILNINISNLPLVYEFVFGEAAAFPIRPIRLLKLFCANAELLLAGGKMLFEFWLAFWFKVWFRTGVFINGLDIEEFDSRFGCVIFAALPNCIACKETPKWIFLVNSAAARSAARLRRIRFIDETDGAVEPVHIPSWLVQANKK